MNTSTLSYRDAAGTVLSFLFGLAAGAALMYLFDPERGAYRRHYLRDKSMRYARDTGRSMYRQADYRMGQVKGALAEARNAVTSEEVSDDTLRERIRAELGHCTNCAQDIEVEVTDGCAVLRGSVPAEEEETIVNAVRSVRSVCDVDNQLSVR
jgi:osmotically-inducible protein OsmY